MATIRGCYPDVAEPVQSFVYCAFFPGIALSIDCAFLTGNGFSLHMCSFDYGPLNTLHDHNPAQLFWLPAAWHPRRDLGSTDGNLAAPWRFLMLRFLAALGHDESLQPGLPSTSALQPAAQLAVPLRRRNDPQAQGDRPECTSDSHLVSCF